MRTPKLISLAVTLTIAVTLLALAACGGGDSTSSTTAAPSGTRSSQGTGSATRTNSANAATDTPSSTADVLAQLHALGKDIKQVTGKVSYTSTDTPAGGTPAVSRLTFYSKAPNSRFDSISSDGSSTAYITTPGTTYICESGSQTCISTPSTGIGAGGLGLFGGLFSGSAIDALVSAAEAKGVKVSKSSENIAGTDATCYSGNDNGDAGKFCFNSAGLLLLTESTTADGSTSGLVATSFSTDVSDSDFQPPYPVTTIPAIPTP